MNPGSVAGGSGSQYFVGDWDGKTFTPDDEIMQDEIKWVDYGTDFYAAISWNNIPEEDGRRLWIGWMNNWDYANEIPTSPWRSAQSVPRSLSLETRNSEVQLIQKPVKELEKLRRSPRSLNSPLSADDEIDLKDIHEELSGKAYELITEIEPGSTGEAALVLRAGSDEETLVGYDAEKAVLFVDRTNSGENDFYDGFEKRFEAPVSLIDGKVKLQLYIDWSSIEVFANDGEVVFTSRIFPDPASTDIRFRADGDSATLESLTFWPLNSVWNGE
jgi:fructan beta-fructosidase